MKKLILLLAILQFLNSCKGQEKIDLSKLILTEQIENVISFNDKLVIGIETVEYPFCLLIENKEAKNYTFDDIDLKGQKIIFQINSEKLKTDSITRFGGGHIDLTQLNSVKDLKKNLKKFSAENKIYGIRIGIESEILKTKILKKLQSKYGMGIKNPNTKNGMYWNIKNENKFIFFAPDYDRLIILNNTNLSKNCYWDAYNGLLDFGGCDNEKYTQELVKNSIKPEDLKNKPIIKIDENWNINGLVLGTTNEEDFVKSVTNKNFERMEEINGSTGKITEIFYQNQYYDFYFYLSANKINPQNTKENFINGYAINNFKKVEVTFVNGLRNAMKFEDVLKLLDKKAIINSEGIKFANYIEIKNGLHKVTLNFDENQLFSGIYIK